MEQQQPRRTKWLTIRMSEEELSTAEALRKQTTCGSLSEYARKVVLGKPVIRHYRNKSLDDYLKTMILLQKELNAIGTNFNQLVRRLHTLRNLPDIQQWILLNEQDKAQLFRQIDTISKTINDAYQLWLRESTPPPTFPDSLSITKKK